LNSSELHCPQVSTVHVKHVFVAFSFQPFKRKKHVDPMHNKVKFFNYQTTADCVLNKTQPQPLRQTASQGVMQSIMAASQQLIIFYILL
jgi:hypothetical protein